MELEFRHWALQVLTPVQWVVYETTRDLGQGPITIAAIAQWCDIKSDTAAAALKVLQKQNFLRYTVIGGSQGILLDWVRTSKDEPLPLQETLWHRRMQYGQRLRSPDGKIHTIQPGRLAQFARDHALNYRCLQYLIDGEISNHKGWTVAQKTTRRNHGKTA